MGFFSMVGGIYVKKRYDIIHALILISFLTIANFIRNDIMKGVLLLLFASVLIGNTALKLWAKKKDKLREQIFYWILLLLDITLAIGAIAVIVMRMV